VGGWAMGHLPPSRRSGMPSAKSPSKANGKQPIEIISSRVDLIRNSQKVAGFTIYYW
jgi:hypothetical protein